MQSRGTLNSEHPRHDVALVARYAAGDAYPSEADAGARLVDGCDECAALAADIRLIAARTSELPQVRRPRDFRITQEQAEQLRGSWLERFMRRFSAPGWAVARPVAAAALTVGVALVVVGALPLGGMATRDVQEAVPAITSGAAGGAPETALVAAQPQASLAASQNANDQSVASPAPADAVASAGAASAASSAKAATTASAPEMGGAETAGPGVSVDTGTNAPAASTSPQQPQPTEVPAPPKALESIAPDVTQPGYAYVGPTAAPTAPPAAPAEHTSQPPTSQTGFDRTWLIVAGLVIAFLALLALAAIWFARNRYEDPLVR